MFLEAILKPVGFSSVFRDWVGIMYSEICLVVKVNIYLLESFSIVRSVCQGCPRSPIFYILSLEPLLGMLEDSRGILYELVFRVENYDNSEILGLSCWFEISSTVIGIQQLSLFEVHEKR